MNDINQPIDEILAHLTQENVLGQVYRVILFGSRARGDADNRSDIDLVFDCVETMRQDEWLNLISVLEDSPTLLKIDAIRYNDASDELRKRINLEGKVIYEQRKS